MAYPHRTAPPTDCRGVREIMGLVVRNYDGLGRGVYSTRPLRKGQVVEISPVIVLSRDDWRAIRGTHLERYIFAWGKSGRGRAMPLGLGGVFNHSDDPNLDYSLSDRRRALIFRAVRDIPAREQLTVDYGWSAKDRRRWM